MHVNYFFLPRGLVKTSIRDTELSLTSILSLLEACNSRAPEGFSKHYEGVRLPLQCKNWDYLRTFCFCIFYFFLNMNFFLITNAQHLSGLTYKVLFYFLFIYDDLWIIELMFLYLHRMRRVDILCKCSSCVTSAKSSA